MNYDPESGQVYEARFTRAIPASARLWPYRCRGALPVSYVNTRGADLLRSMAVRCVLYNLSGLTVEALQHVPFSVASVLWTHIITAQLDSLHIWKVFNTVYAGSPFNDSHHHRITLSETPLPLDHYTAPIISRDFLWITYLDITMDTFSRRDLMPLTKLCNLGTLSVTSTFKENPNPTGDGLVRAWSRAAAGPERALPRLRFLMMRDFEDLTPRAFSYLSSFPSLAFLDATGSAINRRDGRTAEAAGWSFAIDDDLCAVVVASLSSLGGRNKLAQVCYGRAGELLTLSDSNRSTEIRDTPVLDFTIAPSHHFGRMSDPNRSVRDLALVQRLSFQPRISDSVECATRDRSLDSPASDRPKKKQRVIRASKRRQFDDLFSGFG
ncbi:MAG: hypothetical protein M1817_006749 [Caeruleum heppii]|nr:MAG: hypothetical protein M1817_006749 [Caeruleum heppii]